MEQFPEAHKPGYAVYSRKSLAVYDALVLGFSNSLIWRCPSGNLVDLYSRHLSADHLDIGVGTGYFLDKATFPVAQPTITLLDPNAECLATAVARISRYKPRTVQADALVPWPETLGTFQSIGLNYVFHCLPGTMGKRRSCLTISVLTSHRAAPSSGRRSCKATCRDPGPRGS